MVVTIIVVFPLESITRRQARRDGCDYKGRPPPPRASGVAHVSLFGLGTDYPLSS
jgi:hypothetical protein